MWKDVGVATIPKCGIQHDFDQNLWYWPWPCGGNSWNISTPSVQPTYSGWWFGSFLFFFPYIGNVIIPTDELIFFRGVGQPPTSIYQYVSIALLSIGNVMVKMGTKTNTRKPLNFRSGTTAITVNPQCICLETDTFVLLPSPELVGCKERPKIARINCFFFPRTSMGMTYRSFQNLHGSWAANVWIFCRQRKRPSPIWAVRHTAGALFGIRITLLKYLLTILWTVNKHLPNQFVWPTWNKPENYDHILIDTVCTIVHAQGSQYDQSKIRIQHDHLVAISPYIKIITLTYMDHGIEVFVG